MSLQKTRRRTPGLRKGLCYGLFSVAVLSATLRCFAASDLPSAGSQQRGIIESIGAAPAKIAETARDALADGFKASKESRALRTGVGRSGDDGGTCVLEKAIELAFISDGSRNFGSYTSFVKRILPLMLAKLRDLNPALRVAVAQFGDRPNDLNEGYQCFKPSTPLTDDAALVNQKFLNLENYMNVETGDAPLDSLYAAGYVATRYAGFSHNSVEQVSRIMLIVNAQEPHRGGADPTEAYEDDALGLPCPPDTNYPDPRKMDYELGVDARLAEFQLGSDFNELSDLLLEGIIQFSCLVKDASTLAPTEKPPTTTPVSTPSIVTPTSTSTAASTTAPEGSGEGSEGGAEEEAEDDRPRKSLYAAGVASAAASVLAVGAAAYFHLRPKADLMEADGDTSVRSDLPEGLDREREQPVSAEF